MGTARPRERQAATAQAAADRPGAKALVRTADVRIVEYTLQAGDRHPWHYHSEVTDRIYCLEGLVAVDLRDPPRHLVLRPGESHEVPVGAVHHVGNAAEGSSRYLLIQALGKYDFIRAD